MRISIPTFFCIVSFKRQHQYSQCATRSFKIYVNISLSTCLRISRAYYSAIDSAADAMTLMEVRIVSVRERCLRFRMLKIW